MAYTLETKYITNNQYWNLENIVVNGFVQHSVGVNQESADVIVNNANQSGYAASFHACVEPGRVIICAPCKETVRRAKKCYHVGGTYNNTRIGVEMTEPNTIQYTNGSAFIDKDPKHTADFIRRVTDTAAEFMADLCIFHGLGVDKICTHKEAHDRKCGSAHGDPEHIWTVIGYTANDFRRDVQTYIDRKTGERSWLDDMTEEQFNKLQQEQTDLICRTFDQKFDELYQNSVFTKYATIDDVPSWSKDAVKWAIDEGILQGTGDGLNLTETSLKDIVLLYRATQKKTYDKLADVPEWAKASVKKAVDAKVISGVDKEGTLNLTDDMLRLVVMLDRAGVLTTEKSVPRASASVRKGSAK